jgi:hypothetical protein
LAESNRGATRAHPRDAWLVTLSERRSPAMATALGASWLAIVAASCVVWSVEHQLDASNVFGDAAVLPFLVVGVVVARRQPGNAIGWLLIGLALSVTLGSLGGAYAVLAFRDGHRGLPLARLGVVLAPGWAGFIVLMPFTVLVFSLVGLIVAIQFGGPSFLLVGGLPLSIGVGVLRYRLYGTDRLISRTLSHALTALLAGIFIGLVGLTTDALDLSGRVGVAASTLAAADLLNPLRVRVQRLVDRRFNRARYDAEATVAAFTSRLRDAVEIDAIRGDLLDTVNRAVQPRHASVWIKP